MSGTMQQAHKESSWYSDWQHGEHARLFDRRSGLPSRSLVRDYESFNDVRMLNERLPELGKTRLLEIGCATGEFSRYLQLKQPQVGYTGIDLSEPAIRRAKQKYPEVRFLVCDPSLKLPESLRSLKLEANWPVVYTKDVVHHQTDPYGFLGQLLSVCSDTLVLRTRTRDKGETVMDPDLSCQYHYQGWMPYLVLNVEELVGKIRQFAPGGEIRVCRTRRVLGGRENRFLPKECYLPETGTAETSVAVFRRGQRDKVTIIDREEPPPPYPLGDRVAMRLRRGLRRR